MAVNVTQNTTSVEVTNPQSTIEVNPTTSEVIVSTGITSVTVGTAGARGLSGTSGITQDLTPLNEFTESFYTYTASLEQDLTNFALISGGNDFIGDQIVTGSLFVSGTTELGGDVLPKIRQGSSLGTLEKPFSALFVSSGSIFIQSDIEGETAAEICRREADRHRSPATCLLAQKR